MGSRTEHQAAMFVGDWSTDDDQHARCRRVIAARGYDAEETAELERMLGVAAPPMLADAS